MPLKGTFCRLWSMVIWSFQHKRNSLRVKFVLFSENSFCPTRNRVVVMNSDCPLCNDRATIQSLVDKVNCTACPFDAVLERLFLCVKSRKRGQQAGMNIQDATVKRVEKLARQHAHVTSKTNQIHLARLQCGNDFAVMFFPMAAPTFNDQRFYSTLCRFRQTCRVRLIANHNCNLCVGNPSCAHCVHKGNHV